MEQPKLKHKNFSIGNFARIAIKRQKERSADTFIIIYGLPRSGKTTLGFKILLAYILLKRMLFRKGLDSWRPETGWRTLFKKYFATSSEDMGNKMRYNPEGSFCFVDEGLDVVSWQERLSREQKDLLVLIQKTGKRKNLTILITPSLSLLTKEMLARAHYLFIIPQEPDRKEGNSALLFKNYTIPFLAEKFPFGLSKIQKDLEKHSVLASDVQTFVNYLKRGRRFIGEVRFKGISPKLYELYDIIVKEPSIMAESKKRKMVSMARYQKLRYMFDTIVYNLYTKDNKSVAQIEQLITDKFGFNLANRELLKSHLNRMAMMEVRPAIDDEEQIIEEEKKKEENLEDLAFDEAFEEEESPKA